MRVKSRFASKKVLAISLLVALTPPTAAMAKEIKADNNMTGNVEPKVAPSGGSQIGEYWTPERMRNAKPFPLPQRSDLVKPTPQAAPTSNPEVSTPDSISGEASPPRVPQR